jgi:hypothetical protein
LLLKIDKKAYFNYNFSAGRTGTWGRAQRAAAVLLQDFHQIHFRRVKNEF